MFLLVFGARGALTINELQRELSQKADELSQKADELSQKADELSQKADVIITKSGRNSRTITKSGN